MDNRRSGGDESGKGKGPSNGFRSLGLSDPVYRGIVNLGFRLPTPVQRKSLPVILGGSDAVIMARTGSGKTCAFLIPVLEKLLEEAPRGSAAQGKCRAVVLSPTRELSQQTLRVMQKLSKFTKIRSVGINGGEGMEKQFSLLASKPDVIIATPGRLAHHLSEVPDFDLKGCLMCVLDEADRLLEMGFAAQLRQIVSTVPEVCQKVMLSATMPKVLVEFTKSGFTTDPAVVRLDQEVSVSDDLRIAFITCRSADKDAALLHVLQHIDNDTRDKNDPSRTGLTLIFTATRHHVEYIRLLCQASGYDATMIYGTLDQEARKANLAAFRCGRKPILVVTDVAARGIDVPLIDHVVHYSFPSTPKLFVHRSGRAARAGRLGYCWGLVEPDEMPYMVDLYLFLGRRLGTGEELREKSYTLNEMAPDMVHYGSVPEETLTREVENVRRIMESELTGSNDAESLRSLTKVCNNAMKQYRKTRPEASREGVRRAKAILEGERSELTGQRISGGAITPHPLLVVEELEKEDGHLRQERQDFLLQMARFRPKETVFEAFATRGGKDAGVVSHMDRGRTTAKKSSDRQNSALAAMKNMRRQMKIMHNQGATLVVAGCTGNDDDAGDDKTQEQEGTTEEAEAPVHKNIVMVPATATINTKRRLSKNERKRLKKGLPVETPAPNESAKSKDKRGADFRDEEHFMDNDLNSEEVHRSRQMEAAMQPSSANNKNNAALRLEEAMIDIVGDEHADLAQKQRMMRWDKSKRKYVQTTVGKELSGESSSKRLRLESGQIVKAEKAKLGELYAKWQKKTNQSVGRTGVFDDAHDDCGDVAVGAVSANNDGNASATTTKNATQIRKERERKQNTKIKNMKKSDRRKLERSKKIVPKRESGFQGKKGKSGRWMNNGKQR